MDSEKIDALLNKYWNCETSLEEEQLLREHFKDGKFPERQKDAAALFQYFGQQKKKSLNDLSFEATVMAKTAGGKKGQRAKIFFYNTMRIAAGVAVLVMAVWFVRREIRQDTLQEIIDTYDDPKLALEETKKALMMISKSFGRAEEQTKKINIFNEATEEIQKKNSGETQL